MYEKEKKNFLVTTKFLSKLYNYIITIVER
jgi:hypothetical protein